MHLSSHCRRRLVGLALAMAVALAAAACGSSHPGTGIRAAIAPGTTPPSATPTAASPSASAITPTAAAGPVRSAPRPTQQAGASPTAVPSASAVPAPERQIAVAALSSFKVVLTATRNPGQSAGASASVSAAGYENTAQGWKLIAARTIGNPDQWFWYSVSVCGLTVTQLKPEPSSAAPSDTVTVTLLMTPALGCSAAITEDFSPGA